MADSTVLQSGLQQPGWQVDRFIVSTALAGFALLGGLIWLEIAPFMVALFSGIASASLHAWIWFACAFAGSLIGIRLRPWFRLPN